MANTSVAVILGILFLVFSNINIQFAKKEFIWKSYIFAKALLITKKMELIDKKQFAKTELDEDSKTFVIYVVVLEAPLIGMTIHPLQKIQITTLQQNEALIKVPNKYANYIDIFSFNSIVKLPKNTGINKHGIKFKKGKQPLYGPIYCLG